MEPSQVHVDPEQLRAFSEILAQFAQRVHEFDAKFAHEVDRLGNTFRDQDYVKFREAFLSSRQLLKRFVEETRKVVPDLKRDAELIAQSQKVKLDL
jgi:hypothetical protein